MLAVVIRELSPIITGIDGTRFSFAPPGWHHSGRYFPAEWQTHLPTRATVSLKRRHSVKRLVIIFRTHPQVMAEGIVDRLEIVQVNEQDVLSVVAVGNRQHAAAGR
jgi:hypothetical protein